MSRHMLSSTIYYTPTLNYRWLKKILTGWPQLMASEYAYIYCTVKASHKIQYRTQPEPVFADVQEDEEDEDEN